MNEKLITIITLPHVKANVLKMKLESENIDCVLEPFNLLEGSVSSTTIQVKILEEHIEKALPFVEEVLGVELMTDASEFKPKEKKILVPIDFSTQSEMACKMAVSIAARLEMKLVLMHCYINPIIHSIPFSDIYAYDSSMLAKIEYSEENANNDFQEFISRMSGEIGLEKWEAVETEFIIKSGYPENDILAYAENTLPQLIIMGSSGKNAPYGTLGSLAADIMYNAPVPVLIIPAETPEKILNSFSKVLYATNFDEKDFASIEKLMELLKPFDLKLNCVHVGNPQGNDWDIARLEGMKDVLHKKYVDYSFDCQLITGNDILESLEKYIQKEKIEIISLTTHKRNMITRLFNPSLARKMVFHTQTPLLVFHG